MTLPRDVVIPGVLEEYRSFGQLLQRLSPEEWATPSRCDGWHVADVAAHVVGQLSDVVNLRLDGVGTPEVTKRQTEDRRGRSALELNEELEASIAVADALISAFDDAAWDGDAPPGATGTLGFGIEALWFDTFLHSSDIRSALGDPVLAGSGLRPSLSHVAQVLTDQGYGPAELAFGGFETFPISGGQGPTITGDAAQFILAATGRGDPSALGLDETVNIYR